MGDIIGLIFGLICLIVFVSIPVVMIIRAIVKPEQIDIVDGKFKMKKGAIFYNLALQNPIYVKITILCLFVTIFFSFLMYYYGADDEFFALFFGFFMFICAILLFIQCVEERQTLLFGFLPILIYCAYIWKAIKFLIIKIYYLLKFLFEKIVYLVFFVPFKIVYKVLGIK